MIPDDYGEFEEAILKAMADTCGIPEWEELKEPWDSNPENTISYLYAIRTKELRKRLAEEKARLAPKFMREFMKTIDAKK